MRVPVLYNLAPALAEDGHELGMYVYPQALGTYGWVDRYVVNHYDVGALCCIRDLFIGGGYPCPEHPVWRLTAP